MKIYEEIKAYQPFNEQEIKDKETILAFLLREPNVLTRENTIAHVTASAWIVNEDRTKILMVYHNLYHAWSWTGGHADGEENLLLVTQKEAKEETGIVNIHPLHTSIFSLEILTVDGHIKKGAYVSSHLHLNVTYLLEAKEDDILRIKPDENSGVAWFPIEKVVAASSEPWMRGIYQKLNNKLLKDAAISYLERDTLLHIDMIEPIKRGHASLLFATEEGVFLYETKGKIYMLSMKNTELAKRLLASVETGDLFCVHQNELVPVIQKRYQKETVLTCLQAVYQRQEPVVLSSRGEIKRLSVSDLDFVTRHYHTIDDVVYMTELLQNGMLYACMIDGEIAGFVGEHLEGSIGILEVLPKYQRMGIATFLEGYLINQTLRRGNIPFCQVKVDNEASMALQETLGLSVSEHSVYWIF